MRAVVLLLGYLCNCLCLLVLLFIQRHMLLYGRIAHISICAYNCTCTTLIFIYALICALDWLCVVIGRLVRCLWCGCCLLWICQVVRLYMVAIAVWLIWLLYEWLLYMCLCLCVYALLHGGWCCMHMCLCLCVVSYVCVSCVMYLWSIVLVFLSGSAVCPMLSLVAPSLLVVCLGVYTQLLMCSPYSLYVVLLIYMICTQMMCLCLCLVARLWWKVKTFAISKLK